MSAIFSPAAGPAAVKILTIQDLQPSDILLSKGDGLVSNLITQLDGGKYSHGALWSGAGVIQATGEGISESKIAGTHGVYRYPDLPKKVAEDIVTIARAQVNERYAYGELLMLGALFASGLRIEGAILTRMLDAIGGPTASKLKAWLDAHAGMKARVCTELVASAYYDAADARFALKILSRAAGGTLPDAIARATPQQATRSAATVTRGVAPVVDDPRLAADAVAAAQNCRDLVLQHNLGARARMRKVLAGVVAIDAETNKPLGVVTPRDLECSPSLRFVGRLEV